MPPAIGESSLVPWRLDPHACQTSLNEFERLLASRAELSEREDILPFFRAHPHLAALLGSYHPNLVAFERYGLEVPLFGMFQADAIVGDWTQLASDLRLRLHGFFLRAELPLP